MKKDPLAKIEREFREYAESIRKLITFDDVVLEIALVHFDSAIKSLERGGFGHLPAPQKLKTGKQSLSNIRANKSLQAFYRVIYNQAIVIWVSVLEATLESILKYCLGEKYPKLPQKQEEKLKIPVARLTSFNNVREAFPELVVEADGSISFQNMTSIRRTFEEYADIKIPEDKHTHNVAFAMASRHAIVHNAGRIDTSFRTYAKSLSKRTIKKSITGSSLQFQLKELQALSESLQAFVDYLITEAMSVGES